MKLDQSTRMQMLQEVRLMKLVQHPNVVRLYEVGYYCSAEVMDHIRWAMG